MLTDNRQNLKPGEHINQILIKALGELAAHSVLCLIDYGRTIKHNLIDENILDILPNYPQRYYGREIYETPIESSFNTILGGERIYLSRNNKYLSTDEAYTGGPRELIELLSREQLKELNKTSDNIDFLKWEIIKRVNSDEEDERSLFYNEYSSYDFARDITPEFMKKQDIKWVSKMYTFLRTAAPKLWKFQGSEAKKETAYLPFRKAPIIKLQNGEWVAPYINNTTPNVFLPISTEISSLYNFIHSEYMKVEICTKFFQELEIQEPNELDHIRQVILKRYEGDGEVDENDLISDLEIIIGYYKKSISDREEFIELVKSKILLADDTDNISKPTDIYFDTPALKEYFGNKANYFNEDFYKKIIQRIGREEFIKFIEILGVCKTPSIQTRKYYELYTVAKHIKYEIEDRLKNRSVTRYDITDYKIELFSTIIEQNKINKNISVFIWNEVLPKIDFDKHQHLKISYRQKYARYDYGLINVESSLIYELKHLAWIYNNEGHRLPIDKLYMEDLPIEYNYNEKIINLLGLKKRERSIIELGATEEEQKNLDLGRKISKAGEGLSEEEILEGIERLKAEKRQKEIQAVVSDDADSTNNHTRRKRSF